MLLLMRILTAPAVLCGLLMPALSAQKPRPADRAKAAFEKVDTAAIPSLADSKDCVEAHAMLVPLVRQEQERLILLLQLLSQH